MEHEKAHAAAAVGLLNFQIIHTHIYVQHIYSVHVLYLFCP